MKSAALIALVVLCGMFVGCDRDHSSDEGTVEFTGTVTWVDLEGGFHAIVVEDGRMYIPINLPSECQVNGLRVRVTAEVREHDYSIYMCGTLIEIIRISRL